MGQSRRVQPSQVLNIFGYTSNHGVPEHTQKAISEYLLNGWEPSSFIDAVLCNDLLRASTVADHWNSRNLKSISQWVYHFAPKGSHGTREDIDNWINDKDGIRSEYVDKLMQKKIWSKLSE